MTISGGKMMIGDTRNMKREQILERRKTIRNQRKRKLVRNI
jgi:hypothetical protein